MAEYIEREAVLALLKDDREVCTYSKVELKYIRADIRYLPAADVRPVVLCKNCKHRPIKKDGRIIAPKDANGYTDYECPFVCEDSWYNRMTADDDYCSCGEKREES